MPGGRDCHTTHSSYSQRSQASSSSSKGILKHRTHAAPGSTESHSVSDTLNPCVRCEAKDVECTHLLGQLACDTCRRQRRQCSHSALNRAVVTAMRNMEEVESGSSKRVKRELAWEPSLDLLEELREFRSISTRLLQGQDELGRKLDLLLQQTHLGKMKDDGDDKIGKEKRKKRPRLG